MMKKVFAALCVLYAGLFSGCFSGPSTPSNANEPVRIVVTESGGAPIPSAKVSVNGTAVGETDSNGVLSVNRFSGGQITASKDGYFSNTVSAVIEAGKYKKEQVIWLMKDAGGANSSTYSRGSLTRGQLRDMSTGLGAAIVRVSRNLVKSLPKNNKIAVLSITAPDADTVAFVTDGIEQQLFDAGYSLVDRSELDKIKREQKFQASGDVDDKQIVSIGKMAAARIVITGRITRAGTVQSLTLRALDVETGELVSRANEQF